MKKIVLAFDSFKGSVGSFEIAKAAEKSDSGRNYPTVRLYVSP